MCFTERTALILDLRLRVLRPSHELGTETVVLAPGLGHSRQSDLHDLPGPPERTVNNQ